MYLVPISICTIHDFGSPTIIGMKPADSDLNTFNLTFIYLCKKYAIQATSAGGQK